MVAAWAYSSAFDTRVALPDMPVARAYHCSTVFNRTLWVVGGVGASASGGTPGARNDLLSYSVSGREWRAEIPQGNLQMPSRANPACARIDSRWFIAGVPDGTNSVTLHEVDLSEAAAGRRELALVGIASSVPSAALRLGACQGFLFAAVADSTLLYLDTKDASVRHVAQVTLEIPLALSLLVADCASCTSFVYGANKTASVSYLFSLTGTVPLPAATCTYPAPGEQPAEPLSLVFSVAFTDPVSSPSPSPTNVPSPLLQQTPTPSPAAAPLDTPGPTPTSTSRPSPAPRAVVFSFWLSVQATPEECASYLQRHTVSFVSAELARLVFSTLSISSSAEESRVQVTEMRCGSVLFRVEVLKAASPAPGSAISPVPDLFILEAVANLTRGGRLIMPGFEGRPASAMFNASFAPDVPPSGSDAVALARGEVITIANAAPTPPPRSASGSDAANEPRTGDANGSGLALALALYVIKRRRRRAYSAGNAGLATPSADWEIPATSSDSYVGGGHAPASLLQTTTAFDPLSNGSATSVWIDFPALSGREIDLLRIVGADAVSRGGKPAISAPDLTLAQRAAISPPKPIPPTLLKCVQEPLAMLGEGSFGRVYAVCMPEAVATWLPKPAEGDQADPRLSTIKRAVKEVSLTDQAVAAREIHGARLQMLCEHPNVLRCEAIFADRFKLYMVLPLADMSLSSLLANRGVLPSDLVASFALQIASGMAYLHHELARPVAHRDLKPQNILVFRGDGEGTSLTLRLCDFGISRHVETAKSLRGTLVYLPPEIYSKEHTSTKADVWAFGLILMEMATGGKPFGGQMIGPEELTKGQPYPRAAFHVVPEPLRPLARACLDKKPLQRPTFLEIRESLARLLTTEAPRPEPRPRPMPATVEVEIVPDVEPASAAAASHGIQSAAEGPRHAPAAVGLSAASSDGDVRAVVVQVD
eukprot:tig00021462_g21582.t1